MASCQYLRKHPSESWPHESKAQEATHDAILASCGAVKAAIQGKEVPGQIRALFPLLRPAVDQAGPDLVATTKANATIQAGLLSKASTALAPLVREGKLKIVAAYYDLATGQVTLV